jgi:hypothetical protein
MVQSSAGSWVTPFEPHVQHQILSSLKTNLAISWTQFVCKESSNPERFNLGISEHNQ